MAVNQAPLQMQPLEVTDFSGGMTDHFFDGGVTRGANYYNFFIEIDRGLEERPAFVPFSDTACIPPGPRKRSDALLLFINETRLLLGQGRDVFCLPENTATPSWSAILGPSGNQALGAGGQFAVFSTAEFQHQLYVTSDAQPIPSKIYRDEALVYRVRTAGLPRVFIGPKWSDSTLLAICITNANALRASMLSHIQDVGGGTQDVPSATNLHFSLHTAANNLLLAVVPAFNQATLFALIFAENQAFTLHNTLGIDANHYNETLFLGDRVDNFAPLAVLTNPSLPTDLPMAAAMLDDLYQKWYWHQLAVNLHGQGSVNSFALMNKYIITQNKIGDVAYDRTTGEYLKTAPLINPTYADVLSYVNGLITLYNAHVAGGGNYQASTLYPAITTSAVFGHTHPDTVGQVTLPQVFLLDQALLAIAWLRVLYAKRHIPDLAPFNLNVRVINYTTAVGTGNITAATYVTGGGAVTFTAGQVIYSTGGPTFVGGATGEGNIAIVTVGGSGSCTVDRNALASGATSGSLSSMRYHTLKANGQLVDGTTSVPAAEELTFDALLVPSDNRTWLTYAADFMSAFMAHMIDDDHHVNGVFPGNIISQFNPTNTATIPQWYQPQLATVAYAFTYSYEYTVEPNGLLYRNESNPVYSDSIETILPRPIGQVITTQSTDWYADTKISVVRPLQISSIPVLVNDASTNYDTANIEVNTYRTTDGGNTFYLDTTLPNGTLTFNDTANDSVVNASQPALNSGATLYTTGGVVGNDQPPRSKFVHILSGFTYYANIIDTGQYFPNRVLQALPLAPDSAPATFFVDLPDEVTGLSSNRSNLIALCMNSLYRLSGQFNSLGQGAISYEPISQRIGCLGEKSIVQTEVGVFFAGTDGFYYTDGFQIIKVSIDLDKTYQTYTESDNQKTRICGTYDKLNRRIWWTLQSAPGASDCDLVWVYYLNYGIKPSGVFTSLGNDGSLVPLGGNPNNYSYFSPSALAFFNGQIVVAHTLGLVFKMDPLAKSDVKFDLGVQQSYWGTLAIPFNYASCAMDFGTHFKRKYATKINVMGKDVGNYQLQVNSNSDNGRVIRSLAPVNYRDNCRWGDPGFTWGGTLSWTLAGKSDFWRRFPASTLRSNIKQIQLVNTRIGVYRYEDFPVGSTITCDNLAKTATIATPAGFTNIVWPVDCVDMFLATSLDNFVAEYRIISIGATPNTEANFLTVVDAGNTFPNLPGLSWVIRGYKKNQRVAVSSYVVHFSLLGDKNSKYASAADSGENT